MYFLNLGTDLEGLGLYMHGQGEEDGGKSIEMVAITLVCTFGICWYKA